MVLKGVFVAALCTASLALGGVAQADDYRPSEYFSLDLSKAVLSPKRLGPPAQFEPVPVEAKADHSSDSQASVEPKVDDTKVVEDTKVAPQKAVRTTVVTPPDEKVQERSAEKTHAKKRAVAHVPVRAKLARRHSNPLDAQARDTRIQTWPCRTGGICNWQR
ncbi:hypothetical protein JQ633_10295 [Bradyrhizobium tropiciagri]|uniref:hypothetical protein n=1 Tax=Bradyrhizobium tropiciagri TaxID=312253 RepID=UPI001BA62156|nr:hypothetical protein [Bradyrhizobium tropiciagri]MBR0870749.1 hypothetical protein [Bradyrhizobium tropiciagri]